MEGMVLGAHMPVLQQPRGPPEGVAMEVIRHRAHMQHPHSSMTATAIVTDTMTIMIMEDTSRVTGIPINKPTIHEATRRHSVNPIPTARSQVVGGVMDPPVGEEWVLGQDAEEADVLPCALATWNQALVAPRL
ncbi:hypothetical protein ACRE_056640 [Hapsidospora chrysogenum ATCC 11550]|uniref:Uncharacterized protein n=1 Tax=Hapsidospora chrysogenum (strain ATCC 11550 / CBS 779.69 / DSM 880 / IAM 14645 / JCM 23072 / IMI 49137) TaxID=857340 RepID=A0A086T2I3_HAPC1|nr:hypothetical protein ACRE_056640 [Hapsidospora chrysogenum ATCC 11550]